MHESACSIREEKKTPRVFHSPSHFVKKSEKKETQTRCVIHNYLNLKKVLRTINAR